VLPVGLSIAKASRQIRSRCGGCAGQPGLLLATASRRSGGRYSPTRRWKGCPLCKGYKVRGVGQSARTPIPALRKIGKFRRISGHDLGDQLS
jgi:ribosomal protein S12